MAKNQPQHEDTASPPPSGPPLWRLTRIIGLVGLMGAGKSAIGKRLGLATGAPFRDADAEIESAAGMTIPEIFAAHGEPAFREGERRVIARLLEARSPFVLATGGGAFMDASTRALMKERALVVWLRADLDVLLKRVSKKENRPLLKQGDPRAILAGLMEKRHPVYADAHLTVQSDDAPCEATLETLMKALAEAGALVPAPGREG